MDDPFFDDSDLHALVSGLIEETDFETACQVIADASQTAARSDEFLGRHIYLPTLDGLILRISKSLLPNSERPSTSSQKIPVIIATGVFTEGGHSRIVEDLVAMFDDSIVILTNFNLGKDRKQVTSPRAISKMPAVVLPADGAVGNILRLHELCQRMASHVYLLTHHHDVVAMAATAAGLACPVYFVHHSDHRPSLGNTIKNFVHVDLVPHMDAFCRKHLGDCVHLWPMGVRDRGAKTFQYPLSNLSTVSAATWIKFAWEGELAYPKIVCEILLSGVTRHYHIGALPAPQLSAVHAELAQHELTADRFVVIGSVTSLWEELLSLPVHVFVGSAPLHGLRTAMEVQGAGIPFCPYRQAVGSLLDETGNFDPETPTWGTLPELRTCLAAAMSQHAASALRSRSYYERYFTLERMKAAIVHSHEEASRVDS